MTRSKPYPLWLALVDIILLLITQGVWMFGIVIRELYLRN